MNCTKCGAQLDPDSAFCGSCGSSVSENVACTSCGAALESESVFCQDCGAPVGASSQPPTSTGQQRPPPPPPPPPTGQQPSPPPPSTGQQRPLPPPAYEQPAAQAQPTAPHEVPGGFLIPAGYFFALLGGLLGIGIGGMLWGNKVKDALGRKTPKYNAGARRHGLIILVFGAVMFAVSTQLADQIGQGGSSSSIPVATQPKPSDKPSDEPGGTMSQPSVAEEKPSDKPSESEESSSQPVAAQEKPPQTQTPNYRIASPSNDYENLVLDYLNAAYEGNLQSEGFAPALTSFLGSLGNSGRETTTINLPRNSEIAIFGVCDNECSDLDIILRSSSGENLGEDVTTDDIPLVVVNTGSGTEFSVEVRMVTCTVAPCYYAVGGYKRN